MTAVTDPRQLGKIPLFEGLDGTELARLNEMLHCRQVASGKNIITVEQPGETVYIVLNGTVKIHLESGYGSEVILAILGAGEIVGELSMADSMTRSANVVTMENSTVCWMGRAEFWRLVEDITPMMHNLVRIMSRRLRMANAQIQSLATLDVYGRVARQVLAFADEYGEPVPGTSGDILIPLRLTQTDVAGLIGATRVRVNQVLVDYKHRNFISVDNNYRITVRNKEALAQRCE